MINGGNSTFIFVLQIASGNVAFHFPKSNVYLLGNDSDCKKVSIKELASPPGEGFNANQKNPLTKGVPQIMV